MEIQIPVADQDTGTESQLTDRTGYQTISDCWSHDGHVSTSALTSRSFAQSGVFQPAGHATVEEDVVESNNGPGKNVSVGDVQSQISEDGDNTGNKRGQSFEGDQGKNENFCSGLPVTANEETVNRSKSDSVTGYEVEQGIREQNVETIKEEAEMEHSVSCQKEHSLGTEEDTSIINPNTKEAKPTPFESTKFPEDSVSKYNDRNNSAKLGMSELDLTRAVNDSDILSHTQYSKKDCPEKDITIVDSETQGTDISERVFITEKDDAEDEGSDISDVRAKTPEWEEEEEKDGASVSEEGMVSEKLDHFSINSHPRPLTHSSLPDDITPGHRAVVNTPASYYTTTDLNTEIVRNVESRNTSHAGIETAREAAFQRAMTLMTSRCESKQGAGNNGSLFKLDDTSYGPKNPQYFYVKQQKPSPMPPLKAWRGYHGNIYFEPMQIKKIDNGGEGKAPPSLSGKFPGNRHRAATSSSQSWALVPVDSRTDKGSMTPVGGQTSSHSNTHLAYRRGPTSAKSGASLRSIAAISQHHVLYLDKQAVVHPNNFAMHEELQVIEKQQSTGSLNIQQRGHFPQEFQRGSGSAKGRQEARRSGASSAKSNRICKGSVAHKLRRAKSGGLLGNSMSRSQYQPDRKKGEETSITSAELVIIGDKFAAPSVMSPLLRTQTQFSLSSQRITMNSPDLYGAFERLPPLEQVRISLRHMDAHSDDAYATRGASPYSATTSIGVAEELKPFIRYSADVKAQYSRQIKHY